MAKAIINGRKYDTDTAKKLASDYYGAPNDFEHWHEALYLKRTGEYFLAGKGGGLSKYAEHLPDGSRCGGADIVPLTETGARQWAEEHLGVDEYEALFGEVEE